MNLKNKCLPPSATSTKHTKPRKEKPNALRKKKRCEDERFCEQRLVELRCRGAGKNSTIEIPKYSPFHILSIAYRHDLLCCVWKLDQLLDSIFENEDVAKDLEQVNCDQVDLARKQAMTDRKFENPPKYHDIRDRTITPRDNSQGTYHPPVYLKAIPMYLGPLLQGIIPMILTLPSPPVYIKAIPMYLGPLLQGIIPMGHYSKGDSHEILHFDRCHFALEAALVQLLMAEQLHLRDVIGGSNKRLYAPPCRSSRRGISHFFNIFGLEGPGMMSGR
eukprot:g57021.t1